MEINVERKRDRTKDSQTIRNPNRQSIEKERDKSGFGGGISRRDKEK